MEGSNHIFTGEKRPYPPVDVETIQEIRLRIYGMMFARQVEVLHTECPEIPITPPQTDEELIQAVKENDKLLLIKGERYDETERNFKQFLDLLDDLEQNAPREADH